MTGTAATRAADSASPTRTISDALAAARTRITWSDARVLLSHAMQRDAAYLIAHDRDALDARCLHEFRALVSRRAAGEPVAYITGRREFFGIEFNVTPDVLIPRPETELLVELALRHIPADGPWRVLDLGTGCGCIALSIAMHRPQARLTATDCSQDALAVARENAAALGARHVEFAAGVWFAAVHGSQFDLIVSNPPYVAAGNHCLEEGDLRFEPRDALRSGAGGLDALHLVAAGAPAHLAADGWLLFEHGYDQGRACRAMLKAAGFAAVFTQRDLAGIERVSGGRFDASSQSR